MGTPIMWAGFLVGALLIVAVDLLLARGRPITTRKAAVWTGVWVSLSLGFAAYLYSLGGGKPAVTFLTAYVIEYALSVDNLFVFIVVFSFFRVPTPAQHKLLYWGILGAFVLRGLLIGLGTSLVAKFEWLLYGFGAFLLFTAWKLLFSKGEDEQVDPEQNAILKAARRVLPVTTREHGLLFFAREGGRLMATPLFLVLLVVETTDLLFALDSIPAVMGITKDPFLIFTSNAAAILGLRSLFFLVSSLMSSFRFLKTGLGIILGFVGFKLIGETWFHDLVLQHEGLLILGSLTFIGVTLVASILASLLLPAPPAEVVEPGGEDPAKTRQAKD